MENNEIIESPEEKGTVAAFQINKDTKRIEALNDFQIFEGTNRVYSPANPPPASGGDSALRGDLVSGAAYVHVNSLGARPVTSSNDVVATSIASASMVVGQGSGTGRKFIMPDIVSPDVTTLTNSQVREGRITILSNMGSQPRTVELTASCKFNMSSSQTTAIQTIPAKTTWFFVPGIYGNLDKTWTFAGAFSSDVSMGSLTSIQDRIVALEANSGGSGGGGGGLPVAGEVGSYVLGHYSGTTLITYGNDKIVGSSISPSNVVGTGGYIGTLSGTWQILGMVLAGGNEHRTSLFLRIL